MEHIFQEALRILEIAFRTLESQVEKPQQVSFMDGFVFRYREKSTHQALVQKLARIISGLHAASILLEKGFAQEQGVLQRMLDEFGEDVMFLSYGLIIGSLTDLHKEYLKYFYEEEFGEHYDPASSTQKRGMISRKKIRAYIARMEGHAPNPSLGVTLSKNMSKRYSGFVHGASPHIMDMYVGKPARFHVSGIHGTPNIVEYRSDLWNYIYRGILAFIWAAKAFGNAKLVGELFSYCDQFEKQSGTNYGNMATEKT